MGPGAFSFLLLLLLVATGDADMKGHFDPAKCRYALGMQDRTIPDGDISASSSWSDSTAARHSRLESSDGDGAWCPAGPVFPKEEEYLQVDLRRLHLVALVGTQGRHAGGLGKEFSPSYRLRYSRDGHRWMDWRDRWGQEVILGNEDPGGVVLKDLGPPMVARLVRFYPRADRVMSVCLRVELYGCLWKDGLLSYTAPVGQTMYLSEAVHLNDSTYDGYTTHAVGGSLELEPRGQQPVAKAEGSPTAILIGCLVAIILLLLLIIALMVLEEELTVHLSVPGDTILINNRPGPREPPPYQEPRPRGNPPHSAPSVPNSSALLLSNPAYRLLLATYARPPRGPGPPTPAWAKPTNTQACSGDYMEPEKPGAPLLPPPPQNSVPHYAEADIVTLQGVTGGNTYAVPALPPGAAGDGPPRVDFPRSRLRFKEKLGEGQFGEVHLCEVESPQDLVSLDFPLNVRKGHPLLVAVKILRPDATKNARNDFLKEVKIMSRLKDPNIIRLLGVCVQDDPLCMITDYMENGDLNQFLSAHQLEDKATEGAGDGEAAQGPTISYPMLLHVAAQIASGMRYLATLNFVHRDLATRNCLVGENFTIKIADFGMSRNLYAGDYYRVQGRAGKFTTASDVWAFGVTLWEVLMLCRAQPFGQLTDEQVIENAGEFFRDQGRQVYLSRPPACPLSLYELMLRCWSREPEQRPPFSQLHRFLAEDAVNTV
ncbi:DDR1 [Cervus elaphus hippelaphus]|uniref:receptor protein-tyrosine kinase n=1 Tax=Cervus elaphus hippelaphus TaxID=46360 RepID=A0A212D4P1_CEREH|nr:DDR1 [Cervus elaphus hippelaphus]